MTVIYIAANRGEIGGGEVMLLRLATDLSEFGYVVRVVAPSYPDTLAVEARAAGLTVEEVPCRDRVTYLRALRRWDRSRQGERAGVLWCNGLLPAFATSGRRSRLVHLHQLPVGLRRWLAILARPRAQAVVVPSAFMASRLWGRAHVLSNWTGGDLGDLWDATRGRARTAGDSVTVGYLGRIGRTKGVDVLAAACGLLDDATRARVDLLLAGDDRFMPRRDRSTIEGAIAGSRVRVTQPGWLGRREFFSHVDLAVFPSVWNEPFGLVAAEGMEAGCPVIVSDAGALPEVVGPDHPWVVPAGDPAALAKVISAAIHELPADETTAAQRRRWEAEYTPEAGRRHLDELLVQLVDRGLLEAPPHHDGSPASASGAAP